MPAKHLFICIKHLLLLISVSKRKEGEVGGKGRDYPPFSPILLKLCPLDTSGAYHSLVHHGHGFHQGLSCQSACGKWNQLCSYSLTPSLTRRRDWRGTLWCLCRMGFPLLHVWPSRCTQVASSSSCSQWGWDWSSSSCPTKWSLSVCPTKYRRHVINGGTLIAFKTNRTKGRFAGWISHL